MQLRDLLGRQVGWLLCVTTVMKEKKRLKVKVLYCEAKKKQGRSKFQSLLISRSLTCRLTFVKGLPEVTHLQTGTEDIRSVLNRAIYRKKARDLN